MKLSKLKMLLSFGALSFVLVAIVTLRIYGADIVVKPGDSIQEAIDSAQPGATILISPGIYKESLNITKSLVLKGSGSKETVITPTKDNLLSINSREQAEIRIEGIKFEASPGTTARVSIAGQVVITFSGLEFIECKIKVNDSPIVHFDTCTFMKSSLSIYDWAEVELEGCQVKISAWGIEIYDGTSVSLSNCRFAGNGTAIDVDTQAQATVTLNNCYLVGNHTAISSTSFSTHIEINNCWLSENRQIYLYTAPTGKNNWVGHNADNWNVGRAFPPGFLLDAPPKPLLRTAEVGPGKQFSDIWTAIAHTKPGGTVHIRAGTYPGNIRIFKDLNLMGDGPGKSIISGGDGIYLGEGVTVSIQNICVANSEEAGIRAEGSVNLKNCLVMGNAKTGIAGGTLSLDRCRVFGNKVGVSGSAVKLTNCQLIGNIFSAVTIRRGQLEMRNCWVSDNFIGINVPEDPGNVEILGNNNWVKNNHIGDFLILDELREFSPRPGFLRTEPPERLAETTEVGPRERFKDIWTAIAHTKPGGTIHISPGIYPGRIAIYKDLTLIGDGPDKTIIGHSCENGIELGYEFYTHGWNLISDSPINLEIEGIQISSNGGDGLWVLGSAVSISLRNCWIGVNQYNGINIGKSAEVSLISCSIFDNGEFGLATTAGSVDSVAKIHLTDCEIYGNIYGVYVNDYSEATLHSCRIYRNNAGIYGRDDSKVTVEECYVMDNTDGCSFSERARAVIRGNTISGNTSAGIDLSDWATAEIEDNDIQDNHCGISARKPNIITCRGNRFSGNATNVCGLVYITCE